MIGEDFNRSTGGMNLEVWFPQQNEVSVFLESSVTDPDEEQFYETSLFCLFAARQIANGRGDFASSSLAEVLFSLNEERPLRDVEQRLEGDVRVGSPTSRGGRKGFTCEFRPDKRAFFKLHQHGFGMLGKGVAYYAPTSTLALLCWLLRRRAEDQNYQRALGRAAKAVGAAGVSGMIGITSQAQIAMQAAGAGWMRPDDLLPDDLEVSEAVLEACEANDINFGALVNGASGRLQESLAEMEGEGFIALPDALTRRMCQLEVITAADLESDDRIERAFNAVQAAEATEDEAMVDAAYAHYDKALSEVIEENGLEPVVQALDGALFTRDPDRAAEL